VHSTFPALLGDVTHTEHHADIDGTCGHALAASVVSDRILVCVSGRVVALARGTGDANDR